MEISCECCLMMHSRIRGTVEDTELIDGMVFNQKAAGTGGPHRVEKAKIGLIQFCISPPKTDVSISLSFLRLTFITHFSLRSVCS